jgi:predicted PurR-regulated permease PerM
MLGTDGRVVRITWTVVVVLLGLCLVYLVRSTLFVFILAILFAYLLAPLVNLINRLLPGSRKRTLALAIAYVLMVAVVVVAGILIGSRVVEQATELAKTFPATVTGWAKDLQAHVPINMNLATRASEYLSNLPRVALGLLAFAGNLIYVVIIPVLSFLFLKDSDLIRTHILGLADIGPHRVLLDEVLADIHLLLAHYMRALVLLSLATFTAYSIFFTVVGVPYGILLGVLGGAMEFIPMVGPLAAVVVILLVTYASGGPLLAALIFIVVYRMFQDYFLSPHLMGHGVELHPLLVLFGVFAGAEVAGVAGTFLSVPVLALARILYRRVSRNRVSLAQNP